MGVNDTTLQNPNRTKVVPSDEFFGPSQLPRRSTRPRVTPPYLKDYVVTNDNEVSDEELVNFAMFADCDPLTFEETAQDDGWVQAMDEKIKSIEKMILGS